VAVVMLMVVMVMVMLLVPTRNVVDGDAVDVVFEDEGSHRSQERLRFAHCARESLKSIARAPWMP